jgi:hypothetical protein
MTTHQPPEPEAFAIFNGRFIVTANSDGSIPLNSKIVAELVKDSIEIELLKELLRRANNRLKPSRRSPV